MNLEFVLHLGKGQTQITLRMFSCTIHLVDVIQYELI